MPRAAGKLDSSGEGPIWDACSELALAGGEQKSERARHQRRISQNESEASLNFVPEKFGRRHVKTPVAGNVHVHVVSGAKNLDRGKENNG